MQRLVTAGLLPERAGQPVKAWAHISLADLMALDGSSALLQEWTAGLRARWAGHRAEASAGGGDGGVWLDGDAAEGIACDAAIAPIVTGDVNPDALDDLVRLCVQLDRLRHHPRTSHDDADGGRQDAPAPDTTQAWDALERAVIGKAVDLLSGPGGLASFLRRRQLGARLAGPSLPLDIGYSETIPAGIRNAVTLRDQHCQWAGRCGQPASACQVHHVRHKKNGGKTSVRDCVLLCWFHHQVVIHRWGWTLVLNPDGTTTAWNPDKTKVLHSHSPRPAPGDPGRPPTVTTMDMTTHIRAPDDTRPGTEGRGVIRCCSRGRPLSFARAGTWVRAKGCVESPGGLAAPGRREPGRTVGLGSGAENLPGVGHRPFHQREEQGGELTAADGEAVVDARRDHRLRVPVHQPVAFQRPQGLREHLLADALSAAAQLPPAQGLPR